MQASLLTVDILKALSECENLGGILLENNFFNNKDVNSEHLDEALAGVLLNTRTLRWLYVEQHFEDDTYKNQVCFFGSKSWIALSSNSCPLLQVLWIRTIKDTFENNEYASKALNPPCLIPRQLKICMINSDMKLRSQHVIVRRR